MRLANRLLVMAALAAAVMVGSTSTAMAQWTGVQYGPRAFSDAPVGTQAFAFTYDRTDIGIGINPDTRSSVDTVSDAVYFSYTRYFDLGGKSASVLVSIPFVSIESTVNIGNESYPGLSEKGMTDPFLQFNYPLIGGDTKTLQEFFQTEPGFAMSLHTGVRVPLGKYDSSTPLNVGANRFEFRLGLPMSYTRGTPTKQTSFEFIPVVYFFEDNDDPFGATNISQDSAYQLEFHLTHDFSPAVWGAVNAIHVWGGETTTDGEAGNNDFDYWGASATVGMRLSQSLSASATYGGPLKTKNANQDGNQFKIGLTYTF